MDSAYHFALPSVVDARCSCSTSPSALGICHFYRYLQDLTVIFKLHLCNDAEIHVIIHLKESL